MLKHDENSREKKIRVNCHVLIAPLQGWSTRNLARIRTVFAWLSRVVALRVIWNRQGCTWSWCLPIRLPWKSYAWPYTRWPRVDTRIRLWLWLEFRWISPQTWGVGTGWLGFSIGIQRTTGWWWLDHESYFSSWECHHPNWRTHIFPEALKPQPPTKPPNWPVDHAQLLSSAAQLRLSWTTSSAGRDTAPNKMKREP